MWGASNVKKKMQKAQKNSIIDEKKDHRPGAYIIYTNQYLRFGN